MHYLHHPDITLPVVDSEGIIAGVVSRVDVLRIAEHHTAAVESYRQEPHSGSTIADLMHRNVPTVADDTRLEEIVRALKAHRWNRQAAADSLGISRTTLWRKIQKLQIRA